MMDKGCLVISLDFELLWGGLDIWTPEDYGKSHVAHVREAIHRMVALFKKYEAHATFATVGFLMLEDTKEIKAKKPDPDRETPRIRSFDKVAARAKHGVK